MWGWSHADFPLVSQQHGTSHRIEQYHIILIREMCWKAISSSNKWPTAQQKPEESHLCRQRLCHEKSLILNPLTCHPHSKGPLREEGAFSGWERESRTERKGLQGGVRGTLGEKGVLGSHQHLSAKRGACKGKAEAAIPALGWYHVKLSASSLFLQRGFVSHANSGSGPNLPGQALHPNWQRQEKKEGGGVQMGWGVRV